MEHKSNADLDHTIYMLRKELKRMEQVKDGSVSAIEYEKLQYTLRDLCREQLGLVKTREQPKKDKKSSVGYGGIEDWDKWDANCKREAAQARAKKRAAKPATGKAKDAQTEAQDRETGTE